MKCLFSDCESHLFTFIFHIRSSFFFNVFHFFRVACLAFIVLMQAWLTWKFILYQVHYWSDVRQTNRQTSAKKKEQKKKTKKAVEKEEKKKAVLDENEETPVSNGKLKKS